jgi:hypothetical protein
MSKLTIGLFWALALSFSAIVGCSKSNSNNSSTSNTTATVFYSDWIPLHLVLTGVTADSVFEQKIIATELTDSILNKGWIAVFANETGSGGKNVNYVSDFQIYATFTPGLIYLDAYGTFGYEVSLNTVVDSVRYIIVPGTILTPNASGLPHSYTRAQLLQMPYGTLTKTLNIPTQGSFLK